MVLAPHLLPILPMAVVAAHGLDIAVLFALVVGRALFPEGGDAFVEVGPVADLVPQLLI